MKAILEFNLPEDETQLNTIMQAQRVQSFLWDFSGQLRAWYKYHNDFTDANDAVAKIRDTFYTLLNEHEVDLDL
jgi:hypothetical protein